MEARPNIGRMHRALAVAVVGLALAPTAAAQRPAVSIRASTAEGGAPFLVTLRAVGEAAGYTWRLGDGATAKGRVVRHTYGRPGRFRAVVTAISPTGKTAKAGSEISVFRLSLAAPSVGMYGKGVRFRGVIRPAVRGRAVTLLRAGKPVTTVRTGAGGRFRMLVRLAGFGPYRARSRSVVSPLRSVAVRPVLAAALAGTRTVGGELRLRARVRPAGAGVLQVRVVRNGRLTYEALHRGRAGVELGAGSAGSFRVSVRLVPNAGFRAVSRILTATIHEPRLAMGSTGPSVAALERRLAELRYAVRGADGAYGLDTYEAVLAFQKVNGLARTGRVDASLWRVLARAGVPRARYGGDHLEVSKSQQVLYAVRGGQVERVIHVSTGATGNTPVGRWQVYRKVPGFDWVLYYPMYFLRGFAIHGYPSVPAYPASHGCVRVPMWIATRLYAENPYGQAVYVY